MPLNGFDCIIRKVVEDGKTIFPEAFCLTEDERLKGLEQGLKLESVERLKQTNKTKFFSQYNNDPLDEDNLEFKRHWFQKFEASSELAQKLAQAAVVISIDAAYKLNQYNDFTGIAVTKTTSDNNVYILEAKQIKVLPDILIKEIVNLVIRYQNVKVVLIESVVYEMLRQLLQAEMKKSGKFFNIEEVKPVNNQQKPVHIRELIPHYSNLRIFHAPNLYELEDQLLEFPKNQHDDIIDALAYQIKYWNPASESRKVDTIPHGSYAWWKKKVHKQPLVIGTLFNDLRRHR